MLNFLLLLNIYQYTEFTQNIMIIFPMHYLLFTEGQRQGNINQSISSNVECRLDHVPRQLYVESSMLT